MSTKISVQALIIKVFALKGQYYSFYILTSQGHHGSTRTDRGASDVHPVPEASLRLRRARASDLRSDAEDAPRQASPRVRGQGERADSRYAGGERIARGRGQVGGRMAHQPYDRRGHLQQRRAGMEPRLLLGKIGRASCRERVYVTGVAESLR